MPKITAILNPVLKSGTGKTGKPWTLMLVKVDDMNDATMFAPAAVGDEVELSYNDEYKNYNATKVKSSLSSPPPSNDALERIEKKIDQILFKVNGLKTKDNLPTDEQVDRPPVETYEEGGIPF